MNTVTRSYLSFRPLIGLFLLLAAFSPSVMAQYATEVTIQGVNRELDHIQRMERHASQFLSEATRARMARDRVRLSEGLASPSFEHTVNQIWETSPFDTPETTIQARLVRRPNGYELRDLPMRLYVTEDSVVQESGVLIFTREGTLEELYFGINERRYAQLLSEGRSVEDIRRRQLILDFVENFRTAYNRRDLSFLEQVFSDQALIIVGRVVERQQDSADLLGTTGRSEQEIEYIRRTKGEYLERLRSVFASVRFIDVGFDQIDIMQHLRYEDVYGVTLKQAWRTSGYSDEGYIFLLIDYRDEAAPTIHVRTWQPTEYVTEEEVFQLGDFTLVDF